MDFRRAQPEDMEEVAALLERASLPPLPPGLPLKNCLVALDGARVTGAVGLEVRGLRGFLCALVVAPDARDQDLAKSLVQSLLTRASELSLRDLYALPGDQDAALAEQGFVPIEVAEVASEIRMLRSFRGASRDAPRALRLALATRCM